MEECTPVCVCVCVQLCVCERACLLERERLSWSKEEKEEAKCSETDSQRLLLLGLIPSRVSCKDLEL